MKKAIAILLAAAVALTASACSNVKENNFTPSGSVVEKVTRLANAFDADDTAADLTADGTVTLSGAAGTVSDASFGTSGSQVTVTKIGTYTVTGTSEGVTLVVDEGSESGTVCLVLSDVTMTNTGAPCILVKSCGKLVIRCEGENSLTSTGLTESDEADGAIYSKDDLTLGGSGSLSVTSSRHGIVCNDDLKFTGGTVTVSADALGVKSGDSVKIGGGSLFVTAGHDGIQVENAKGDSCFYMEDGVLTVEAGYDGVQVSTSGTDFSGNVTLAGGTLALTAGGGASRGKDENVSQKGIKCAGDVYVGDVSLTVSSADDALHSNTSLSVTGGTLSLASGDDGIHADSALAISGGSLTVSRSYEGLEAYAITVSGGEVAVTATDDGMNAAGGSDSASSERGPWGSSSGGTLTISGGHIYVNAGGDGLDSNGSIYVTGGITLVEGPVDNGNGALDIGEGQGCVASITGGTVLAIGSAGMAVNFNSGSQCAGLVSLSGTAGTLITVEDGSGFTFTASKPFSCAVYSAPSLKEGGTYTISAGDTAAQMDFSAGLYYSNAVGFGPGGGPAGPGGGPGGRPGGPGGRR